MQERGMRVGAVGRVRGALVADEGAGGDPGADDEGGDAAGGSLAC
jgi:hypothetical protein